MHALVHAADIQDRDGGAMLMATLFGLYPFLLKLYADGGYQGPVFQQAMKAIMAQVDVDIVKRSDQATGFVVLPKRWVVERTLAWLHRCRRLAKDWECLNRKARAFLLLASIRLMVRRLVLQPEFPLSAPQPAAPVGASCALLVLSSPRRPSQRGLGVDGPVKQRREQAPDLGHGERQQLRRQVHRILSPRQHPCG